MNINDIAKLASTIKAKHSDLILGTLLEEYIQDTQSASEIYHHIEGLIGTHAWYYLGVDAETLEQLYQYMKERS